MSSEAIKLFKINGVKLYGFSLYPNIETIDLKMEEDITCLTGANGLGKSTFLNIIVFGLTGLVKNHKKEFESISRIRESNYAEDYFSGRISQTDKERAYVEIELEINGVNLIIRRNFLSETGFEYVKVDGTQYFKEDIFENAVCKEMNLSNFEQFIFLVQYVFLFDESRETIFWNNKILTNTINLLIGMDSNLADEYDELSKEIVYNDGKSRHCTWDIKKARDAIDEIQKTINKNKESSQVYDIDESIIKSYSDLNLYIEDLNLKILDKERELKSVQLILSQLTIKIYEIESKYEKEYEKVFEVNLNGDEEVFKKINDMVLSGKCMICNNIIDKHKMETNLSSCTCPLCDNKIIENSSSELDISILEKLDCEIGEIKEKIKENMKLKDNLENKIKELEGKLITSKNTLNNLELKYKGIEYEATKEKNGDKYYELIKMKYLEIQEHEKTKQEFIIKRDLAKSKISSIRDIITQKYNEVSGEFIQIFTQLAKKFIGLNVTIRLSTTSKDNILGYDFIVEMEESDRNFDHQLSESQRYFLDIALRMAFIIYASKNQDNSGILLLDTPEGYLDIAYENNAAEMFIEFIEGNTQLIITANINSSGLLKTLTIKSKKEKVKVINMLEWSDLTSVQQENRDIMDGIIFELKNNLNKERDISG